MDRDDVKNEGSYASYSAVGQMCTHIVLFYS